MTASVRIKKRHPHLWRLHVKCYRNKSKIRRAVSTCPARIYFSREWVKKKMRRGTVTNMSKSNVEKIGWQSSVSRTDWETVDVSEKILKLGQECGIYRMLRKARVQSPFRAVEKVVGKKTMENRTRQVTSRAHYTRTLITAARHQSRLFFFLFLS